MSKRNLIVYLIVPAAINLVLIGAYFSGVSWLQTIVSPVLPGMNPDTGREFGLLENLQNVLLISIVVVAAIAVKRKPSKLEKAAFACLFLLAVFVFLEEIDYGLHYYEYVMDVGMFQAAQVRNVHNIGGLTKFIKKLLDLCMALFFVVAPLALAKSGKPLLRYLTPDRYSVLTMIVMVLMSKLAHLLNDLGFAETGSIHKNISEFRELTIYYIFLVYLCEVVLWRAYTPREGAD